VFPPITDLRTGTPLTLVDNLQVETDCSPYAWTDTLTALLSNTAHAAVPVTISVVPYTTYNVTFVFTDLPVTELKPGDVMTLVFVLGVLGLMGRWVSLYWLVISP
jgi:hypothetical protein